MKHGYVHVLCISKKLISLVYKIRNCENENAKALDYNALPSFNFGIGKVI